MDFETFKKMIEDSGVKASSLADIPLLKRGVVFIPPRQIGDWKDSYVVVAEREGSFLCVRLSSHDESLAGTYDIMAEGYIIETWNAFVLPKDAVIKGYTTLPESILQAVSEVRAAWMRGELPNVDYPTGGDILSSPDRVLFHEAEIQANESLQKAWNEGTDQFVAKALWQNIAQNQDISDFFAESEEISSLGKLSAAVFPPQYILFSWDAKEETPPPEIYIRYTGNAWITSSEWKEVKRKKLWQFSATIPESAKALVLRIGETECLMEVSPSEQIITSESPLSLALFQAFENSEFALATEMPKELFECRFTNLEMQALKQGRLLSQECDQACFLIAFALCSDLISRITRLFLFDWAEKKLSHIPNGAEDRTVFAKEILSKVQSFKDKGYTLTEWFYKAVYGTWHKKLDGWKSQIDKSMYYEVEDVEEAVGDLLDLYESWQNRVRALAVSFSGALAGNLADLSDKIGAVLRDRISGTSTPSFAWVSSQRLQSQMGPINEEAKDMPETIGIKTVEILDPDEWYGIFSHPENEDEDMKEFLNTLSKIRADYYWGGLKVLRDGTIHFILDHVAERVPDIRDPEIELSAANDSILLLVGVSSDEKSLKSAIEDLKKIKDQGGEFERKEMQEDSKPIVWINYYFTFNSQG